MQDLINKLRKFEIFKDFSDKEFSIFCVEKYADILENILSLDSKFIACISVTQDSIKCLDSTQNLNIISEFLSQNALQNGLHIFLDSKDSKITNLIYSLKPWRKGPFFIHFLDIFHKNAQKNIESKSLKNPANIETFHIDTEWRSDIKLNLILNTLKILNFDISDKEILDVGCNNGYYMFDLSLPSFLDSNIMESRILDSKNTKIYNKPKSIVGIDPVGIFFLQFLFLKRLLSDSMESMSYENSHFRLFGIQDVTKLNKKFDLILCMGVLYHRQEPLLSLKLLKKVLKKDGLLLIETLIIYESNEITLCPYPTYAGMKNVYYIFSPKALENLAKHAGFTTCKLISFSYTTNNEQRSTDFIFNKSLGDFLNFKVTESSDLDSKNSNIYNNEHLTIEGYPPPCRAIFELRI